MVLAEIGTAGVISACFFRQITSDLNVSHPIEGQPVQLSYYLCVFGCGLYFWFLVLYGSGDRQADIRKVAKLAKLIAPITTLNLCGCLLAPFMKLPLLVRFLVLFQVSSNLALILIWAFLSLEECTILRDAHTQQQQKSSPEPHTQQQQKSSPISTTKIVTKHSRILGPFTAGFLREISSPESHRGASGSGHGSGASGSGGGSEGGDRGRDRGGADLECGGRVTNREAFESSEIIKMSLTLTAQTTGTLMGFHQIPTPSSSSKALLAVALMDQLVAYLCGVTGILLSSYKSEDSEANKIFAGIGFVCYSLGYVLMIAMYVAVFVPWYSVLIVILLFGVVWLILFRNRLKTRATEVWNYLKNST